MTTQDAHDEGILVPTDEHSESPKHYTILFHPQPDEMTFEQSVMHVRRTMYWDYLDGQWCDISLYPLGKWKLLEEQLKAAHEREMRQLEERNKEPDKDGSTWVPEVRLHDAEAENAKLRELARMNWFIALSEREALRIHGVDPDDGAYITVLDETIDEARATMQELGIEVD